MAKKGIDDDDLDSISNAITWSHCWLWITAV